MRTLSGVFNLNQRMEVKETVDIEDLLPQESQLFSLVE